MASNLKSARQAIEAELAHARKGAAYYASRVEALAAALEQLESVEAEGTVTPRASKRAANGTAQAEPRRGRKRRSASGAAPRSANGTARRQRSEKTRQARSSRGSSSLPTTGGEFWLKLVNEEPRSAVDISNAAIEALGIRPDQTDEIQKLKQRVAPALAGLLSAHKIEDTGAGRERRFFRRGEMAA